MAHKPHSSLTARTRANRSNARKSTGPRTPEGKARSSQNAVTHGLFARALRDTFDRVEAEAEADLERKASDRYPDVKEIAAAQEKIQRLVESHAQRDREHAAL